MKMKYKLFRVISPLAGNKKGTLTFPPISLGIIYRHLKDNNFNISQDDLHCLWHKRYPSKYNEKLLSISNDEKQLWNYIEGNSDADWEWFGQLVIELSDFKSPDIFLFSLISSDLQCCRATLALAFYLKKRFNKKIILGGEYFAYAPIYYIIDKVFLYNIIDYYIIGYAEDALVKLLNVVSNGKSIKNLNDIPGLVYLHNNKVEKNPLALEHQVVPPSFDGLPIDFYKWSAKCIYPDLPNNELTLPFHLTTGCPHNCSFCDCSGIKKMSVYSPKDAVFEIKQLVKKHDCKTIFFLDNTINISKHFITELCNEIIKEKLNIQWMACGSVCGMDKTTLMKMRKSGAIRIVWGLETGSNRLLQFIKKPFSLEKAIDIFKFSHEIGIWNGVDIIVGLPTETNSEFHETLHFLDNYSDILDEVWVYQFYLNTMSDMCNNAADYGILNLQPVNRTLTKDAVNGSVCASYVFDEINGLKWKAKEKQLKSRMGKILMHIAKLKLYPMGLEHEQQANLLSWCYRQSHDKDVIKNLYHQYWEKLQIHRTWKPAGYKAENVIGLSHELLELFNDEKEKERNLEFDNFWKKIYPEKYMPFYQELPEEISYPESLLIDGMFHDMLIYSRIKKMLIEDKKL